MLRVWHYTEQPEPPRTVPHITARGVYLLQLEFLTRYPTMQCIVTSQTRGIDTLASLFPKTLFHVYRAERQAHDAKPEPNLLYHTVPFDKTMARNVGEARQQVSVIFTGEALDRQMALYMAARPVSALMLLTSPPDHYLQGELIYPLHCERNSHLCALVPSVRAGEQPRAFHYDARRYVEGMLRFHETCRADGEYDKNMEALIVRAYAGGQCGAEAADLLAAVVQMGLPRADEPGLLLWSPPEGDA
jgi:hypothetical protein